jgi:hypothetical protein
MSALPRWADIAEDEHHVRKVCHYRGLPAGQRSNAPTPSIDRWILCRDIEAGLYAG